ncbi:hypothetical protein C0Q70_18919 [Pomacea canaliculata]|uniref:Uncharacterized protein n=1 Tax=Pomacea canaliculata TaxID=400727 RepID=A0A2T7NHY8_POMCA|nr:hypothetical protein C0Q70_18919 [Pomacea canaliculata]
MSGCWREEKRKTKYCACGEKRARREKEERRRKRKRMRESRNRGFLSRHSVLTAKALEPEFGSRKQDDCLKILSAHESLNIAIQLCIGKKQIQTHKED